MVWSLGWDRPPTVRIWSVDNFSRCLDASLNITVSELPAGTASYSLDGAVTCNLYTTNRSLNNGLLRPQVQNFSFSEKVPVSQTVSTLAAFEPVKAWIGILTTMKYKNFSVKGTIRAFNDNGVDITPRDPATGRYLNELTWDFADCPQPPEKE